MASLRETRRAPEISRRALEMPESPIRKLAPLAALAKRRGVRILHLNIGQPDLETPACMRERLAQIDARVLEYSPSAGTPEYLRSLVRYYVKRVGVPLSESEVLATTGGSEALLFAFIACAGEGDEVLVVEPTYANYRAFATMAGVRLTAMTSRLRDGFHLPPRDVWERAVTPRTRAILFSNPGNPTGVVYTREELEMVADLCRDRGLFLISDEVYREFVYDGRKAVSALELSDADDLVVVIDSLSKRFSACGIRLGSLITRNGTVYQSCLRMAQGRLSPPALAQFVGAGADELGDDYFAGVVAEYQRRRDVLHEGLTSIPGVILHKPEGAFYCVAKLPVHDAEEFSAWLLREFQHEGETLMLAPAGGFYLSPLGTSEVRIAYVLREKELRRAVELLRIALEAWRDRSHSSHPSPR